MYKKRILEAVEDLDRPLVSRVLVNGELVRVEYEALLTICFSCGQYGHLKEICTLPMAEKIFEIREASDNSELSNQASNGESLVFGPWMVVERKTWWG
ncbi:hypothetical protein J1N35_007755 [Gossypium stocksii]|uniref:CCHC-type domain-containing protein n=1 Tax=Gossypium stocksii TaxID=47602 RepID=A0A9D3W840_9ROSI|nr:hypothetical protein J1N35_007755 [Gossypium stocksii]